MGLDKVIQTVQKYDGFLLCAHINLEGDALGSQLAIANLLRKLGKKVYVVDADKPPATYNFLPGIKHIKQKITKDMDFEVIIFLDCSDMERVGDILDDLPEGALTVNIDHHISNTYFAKINWVDPHSSSTAEMIYRLFKQLNIKLSYNDALLLYTALVTDTGSFRYPNTTRFTHEIVADLLRFNISVSKIFERIYESNTFSDVVLLNRVFSTLQKHRGGKVVWMELTSEMIPRGKSRIDQTENILNVARSIKGLEVILLFKQADSENTTRVNFRSRGKIDVNKIASHFGGGGHKTASGCTIKEKLEVAKKLVLDRVDKEFERLRR